MVENIIQTILDHKVVSLAVLIATFVSGWAAVQQLRKEHRRKRKIKQKVKPNLSAKPVADLENPEGTVPLGSAFYVDRPPIESDCYEEVLNPTGLICIKAPRQMGKSSLMSRILDHAAQQGCRTVSLNFQQADNDVFADLDRFLQWVCISAARKLNLPPDQPVECWMDFLGSKDNCTDYFQKCLLNQDEPLVLGLDEVDKILQHEDVAADFFGLLRVWHEQGKTEDIWKRLRLVIVHSKEVYISLRIHESPFNVGLQIELPELDLAQVQDLAKRHGLGWSEEQVRGLMAMLGGHPYLLRVAMYDIARVRTTLEKLLSTAATEEGIYAKHLRRHLLILQKDNDLISAMKQVIKADTPVQIENKDAFKLSSMGLVKYKKNEVMPLCDLYRQYFRVRL